MNLKNPYIVIPITLFVLIILSTKAFDFLSEKSDVKVLLGCLITALCGIIIYKLILYILNTSK